MTDQTKMEEALIERNRRHLQQIEIEDGVTRQPMLMELKANQGINATSRALLDGTYSMDRELTEEQAAYLRAITQTDRERAAPKVRGAMTKQQYKRTFQVARERMASSPSQMHYTLWKAMAESDELAEFQCIMISLPFMYGFVCIRWLREIDAMLEKKRRVRRIHTLWIIGLLEADFNSALKHYFAGELM